MDGQVPQGSTLRNRRQRERVLCIRGTNDQTLELSRVGETCKCVGRELAALAELNFELTQGAVLGEHLQLSLVVERRGQSCYAALVEQRRRGFVELTDAKSLQARIRAQDELQ